MILTKEKKIKLRLENSSSLHIDINLKQTKRNPSDARGS